MELAAVVVADETGHLLEVRRLELHAGRGAETRRLLTTRDECLREEAADRLAAVDTQVPLSRAQAEQLLRSWRSQPLKRDREGVRVEVVSLGRIRRGLGTQTLGRGHLQHRDTFPIPRAQPAVLAPCHRLNRCLASERAAAAIGNRTTT